MRMAKKRRSHCGQRRWSAAGKSCQAALSLFGHTRDSRLTRPSVARSMRSASCGETLRLDLAMLMVDCGTPAARASSDTPPKSSIAVSSGFMVTSLSRNVFPVVNTYRVRPERAYADTCGMTFANNLRALRLKAGLTQEELALRAGFPGQSRVGNYESGGREPSFSDLEALARALDVDQARLVRGDVGEGKHEQDADARSMVIRSLVHALVKTIPISAPIFAEHLEEQARKHRPDPFSTHHGILAEVLNIAVPGRHKVATAVHDEKRSGSSRKSTRGK